MTTADRPLTGVLGGTFDPVHLGHLHVAGCVRRTFAVARVLLVPCALPPHKTRPDLTAPDHRLAMLRLAIAGLDGLEVSTIELDRGGVSYTIDTLRTLARSSAPAFILGADSLLEITTWHRHAELLSDFDLIAVDRPGRGLGSALGRLPAEVASRLISLPFVEGAASRLRGSPPGAGGRIYHLPIPAVEISSSQVRGAAAAGSELSGLVPPSVARYIQAQRLYRREERR